MASSTRIYEFGPFLLDVGERRLFRNGRPMPLRGKVFETLRVLVENHGRLVAKDALMKAVWPTPSWKKGTSPTTSRPCEGRFGAATPGRTMWRRFPGRATVS